MTFKHTLCNDHALLYIYCADDEDRERQRDMEREQDIHKKQKLNIIYTKNPKTTNLILSPCSPSLPPHVS